MGLTWGRLRISQESTDVIGDASWQTWTKNGSSKWNQFAPTYFHVGDLYPKKNLTRIQIIPNDSPVQLSILTPQNYLAILGIQTLLYRFTLALMGLWVGEISQQLQLPAAKSLEAFEILDPKVGEKLSQVESYLWGFNKCDRKKYSKGKNMKKWKPPQAASISNSNPLQFLNLWPETERRGTTSKKQREEVIDKERISNVTVIFSLDLDMKWDSKLPNGFSGFFVAPDS